MARSWRARTCCELARSWWWVASTCSTASASWRQRRLSRTCCCRISITDMLRILAVLIAASLCSATEKVEVLRDEFWVPHIFASTPAGAAFASGYVQAQDRLGELMRKYPKSRGPMSQAFGAGGEPPRLPQRGV